MTAVLEDTALDEPHEALDGPLVAVDEEAPEAEERAEGSELRLPMVAGAAALSTAAAAWMAGGLIQGFLVPRGIGLLGAAIGVGLVALSFRLPRPAVLQYAVVPVAALTGGLLIAPVATGGTANLPGLVGEVFAGGGLRQPPIPFDPGWRFILVVTFAVIGNAALATAVSTGRAKLAVLLPLPVTFGAALLQPSGHELTASTVAIFLVVAAIALSFGAEVASGAEMSKAFELRRLAGGAGMLGLLMVVMVLLSQTSFLFPQSNRDRVIPPQKPPKLPLEADRELFRVIGDRRGPWRVGVLDTYDGRSWLLPESDPKRATALASDAVVGGPPLSPSATAAPEEVSFRLVDMKGRALPVPAGLLALKGAGAGVSVDPRTLVPQLEQRIPRGFDYTAVAARTPTAQELNDAPPPAAEIAAEFTRILEPPNVVQALLVQAPPRPFDRMQFLRDRLYANVVAAGSGSPVDVPVSRIAGLLEPAAEATPYEITAAEAMLARWAGVPSRIGYGYFGGNKVDDGFSLRPKHGAAWLEAYFEGFGWVPLVGTPPRAKSSLSKDQQNQDPRVQPTEELALTVFIPMQRTSFALLFQVIRFWLLRLGPLALGVICLFLSFPAACKLLRSHRRRRWGQAHGPLARVAVAYAQLRDECHDLNLGDIRWTPLEFEAAFEHDDEHEELAWSVTRLLWGDLRRDAQPDDAAAVEKMAASVGRRIAQAQTPVNRIVAKTSRASLRDPYWARIPNVWPRRRPSLRPALRAARRLTGRFVRRPSLRAGVIALAMLLVGGCVSQGGFDGAKAPTRYPDRIAPEPPETLVGFELVREPTAEVKYAEAGRRALVTGGQVFTVRRGDAIEGSLQVALLRPDLDGSDREVQANIEKAIGGRLTTYRVGPTRLRLRERPEQDIYLWFPPERNVMIVMVLRRSFGQRRDFVRAAVAYIRGLDPGLLAPAPPPPEPAPPARPSDDGGPA